MSERKPKWLGETRKNALDNHIHSLEARIEKLKVLYNQFFSGEIPTPPEKEREDLEKQVRRMLNQEHRSPRINLLVQNMSARFTLFNNQWLKQLHDLETDINPKRRPRGSSRQFSGEQISKSNRKEIPVSLNREDSFEEVFSAYKRMMVNPTMTLDAKEKWINSLKTKMISANLVDAQITISREEGQLKIRVKK